MSKPLPEEVFKHLDQMSADFNAQVGHTFTNANNHCVQGIIERLKLMTHAFATCSPAALSNLTKKYNKQKKAQGGLKFERALGLPKG